MCWFLSICRRLLNVAFAAAIALVPATPQEPSSTLKFEVASVKPSQSDAPPSSNFPLGPGDVYARNGGYFSATGYPLSLYISFAFKMIGNQGQYLDRQLPGWAKTERFDIQARAASDPGKDGMRLMMRALLAERFHFAMHYEKREEPVVAFVLAKPGKLGPELHAHSADSPCPTELPGSTAPAVVKGSPAFCNGIYPLPASTPGHLRFGGRNVTLAFIADTFSAGVMGRPMIDRTGLSGTFDFTLEWAPPRRIQKPSAEPIGAEPEEPAFDEAVREQLGLKLQSVKALVEVPVLDSIERPTAN